MVAILSFILILYIILLCTLLYGWYSRSNDIGKDSSGSFISVIIPYRNEEYNLQGLLNALVSQDFPLNRYEIILVNDHSEDLSEQIIDQFVKRHESSNIIMARLDDESGKKQALKHGIAIAKGEVIVTTDADCIVKRTWLSGIDRYYSRDYVQMVFGPVTFCGESTIFHRLQTIEFASLVGAGAASLSLGMPNMCNGANLSFRKRAYCEAGGYEDNMSLASGDDEFLMHKFWTQWPDGVLFNNTKDAVVCTKPHNTWLDFYQQRKRWASKWKHYKNRRATILAILVATSNMAILVSMILLVIDMHKHTSLAALLVFKFFLEGLFIGSVLKKLSKKMNILLFILLQFIYPLYAILFGIAANFGTYNWKGRRH